MDSIVPDSIEPIEAYRCWTLHHGKLKSLNGGGVGEEWTPGQHLTAKCNAGGGNHRWSVVRLGMSYEKALEVVKQHNAWQGQMISFSHTPSRNYWPQPPTIELPAGYGFQIEEVTHDAPDEGCSCGIYAATTEKGVPGGGNVYGKVKLWGKVVPGENGYRAEFAYPSEFRVSPKFVDHPTLVAFGVPIVADEKLGKKFELSINANVSAMAFSSLMGSVSNTNMSGASFAFGSQKWPLWKRILISPWTMGGLAVANLASIGVNLFVR